MKAREALPARAASVLTQADEVMISTFIYGHEERMRSYELLAAAFAPVAA